MLTVVYGFNTIDQRKNLWQELNMLAQGISQPWLIAGDCNALLSPKDRLAGAPVTMNAIRDFAECVKDIGVMNCNERVVIILGTTSSVGLIEFLVGLIELLEMMNGWENGVMLFCNIGIHVFLIISPCNYYYKKLNNM